MSSQNNDDASQQFCVRWNSHLGSLGAAFPQLLAGQQFVDVTLACEGHQLHCHRLVLAACSSFFESLFSESPCKHPIIILPRDIKLWEIQALVDFMYKGEVNVSQAGLTDLLKCAEILQIRGLSGNDSTVNLNTIKDQSSVPLQRPPPPPSLSSTAVITTIDNNLIQNELKNDIINQQQQQQQQIDINNKSIVTDAKLITTTTNTNIPFGIPISTLSSTSSTSINNNNNLPTDNTLLLIKSPPPSLSSSSSSLKGTKYKINLLTNQQENMNIIKNNDDILINNEQQNKIINKNQQLLNLDINNIKYNNNNDVTTITPTSSLTIDKNYNNNCNKYKQENQLQSSTTTTTTSFQTVPIKPEHIQKNNIKCDGNDATTNDNSIINNNNIMPFVIPKTEPFDTNIYDESMDDAILNDDETDLMNVDHKSDSHDFPLSNVVCEYDSNGLQINMETPGRRVRRSEAILRQAAECVSKGQTFQTVSDMFSIPISTIRFFMARKGILPRRKRGRTAGMTVIGSNGIIGNIRNSTIGEINISNTDNSRSVSPFEPPFHFVNYKLPELKPKLL